MAMPVANSIETWVLAFAALRQDAKSTTALSMCELADGWGITAKIARDRVRRLIAAGRVVCEHKLVQAIDGRFMTIPAYKLVVAKPASKSK